MYAQLIFTCHPINIVISVLILLIIPVHYAQEVNKEYYSTCSKNTTLICGNSTLKMVYPFWGGNRPSYCGLAGYELGCLNGHVPVLSIGSDYGFRVVEINPSTNRLILERYNDHLEDICPTRINSIILNQNLFSYGMGTVDLFVYHCSDSRYMPSIPLMFGVRNNFTCRDDVLYTKNIFGTEFLLQGYVETLDLYCDNPIKIPVDRKVVEEFANDIRLQPVELLKPSFKVHYIINRTACSECEKNGGLCWRNTNSADYSQCLYKPSGETMNLTLKIGIGAGSVAVISILFLVLLLFILRMKNRHSSSSYPKDVEAFIEKYGSSIPKSLRYSTLKKITNSFESELGKGGYGNVYKGKLSDGCVVAVKVLNATKGNGEDFMNEVASIGRTSHVNVVNLLGFVYEGNKRALIYEFMPNGSLEKFIYGTAPLLEQKHLSWEKLYNIALGIARGLEYLHCGCTTHILHLDIKPHNILLDEDFCPKISDFGLAKLYTGKGSMVSSIMLARGTIGYIAPEVFSRNFGPVSHKSDVYSYGMMILEMVGGRKNVNARADRTSDIYFPSWVYKQIEVNEEPEFADDMTDEENNIARKMMIVGLWCIQTNPSQRPSITKVIEMFEGNVAALEIPPKPYLYSPPTSPSSSQQKTLSSWSSSRG